MLTLSMGDIAVFQQVLKYLEEYYIPNGVEYTDKFQMLFCYQPIAPQDLIDDIFVIRKKDEREKERTDRRNLFCETIITYLDNDFAKLWDCCQKAHLSKAAFKSICDRTFLPGKVCVYNLIIAAKFDFARAIQLLESAAIHTYQFNKLDVVMQFFFQNEIYDFSIINKTLYLLDLPMLGYTFV